MTKTLLYALVYTICSIVTAQAYEVNLHSEMKDPEGYWVWVSFEGYPVGKKGQDPSIHYEPFKLSQRLPVPPEGQTTTITMDPPYPVTATVSVSLVSDKPGLALPPSTGDQRVENQANINVKANASALEFGKDGLKPW